MTRMRSLKITIIVLAISTLSLAQYVYAQDNLKARGHDFSTGNSLYEEANYDGAIASYNQLIKDGFESGNLYYNIGNCYFKKGELGQAILYYEKARRLIPRDRDLQSNYRYALSLVRTHDIGQRRWFIRIKERSFGQLTIDGITLSLSLLYIIIVLVIFVSVILSIPKKYSAGVWLSLVVIFIFVSSVFIERMRTLDTEGVIVQKGIEAKFEPFDKATTHFGLHEGERVNVLIDKKDWYKIRRSDGKIGWVQGPALDFI